MSSREGQFYPPWASAGGAAEFSMFHRNAGVKTTWSLWRHETMKKPESVSEEKKNPRAPGHVSGFWTDVEVKKTCTHSQSLLNISMFEVSGAGNGSSPIKKAFVRQENI